MQGLILRWGDDPGFPRRAQCNGEGPSEEGGRRARDGSRCDDGVTRLESGVEGAVSRGLWAPSRSCRRLGHELSPEASRRKAALLLSSRWWQRLGSGCVSEAKLMGTVEDLDEEERVRSGRFEGTKRMGKMVGRVAWGVGGEGWS